MFFEDISSSLMCIPPDKTSMFSKQESLISSSDCWICAWTCMDPIPILGLIPSWIIGQEKLHRNVRLHWNLESLLSICYWRTTANGHFSSSHFLDISRKYVSLEFGRWSALQSFAVATRNSVMTTFPLWRLFFCRCSCFKIGPSSLSF